MPYAASIETGTSHDQTDCKNLSCVGLLGFDESSIGNPPSAVANRGRVGVAVNTRLISKVIGARNPGVSMENNFVRIVEKTELEDLISRSQEQPVVIFKDSNACPVSAAAYSEMEQFDGEVALVEIQRARELSKEIEQKTGIRHESPQVIVLDKGNVIWNASHWKVTALAVAKAVEQSGK